MMTKSEILEALEASTTQNEWDAICTQVKRECGGMYPDWWFGDVSGSGFLGRKAAEFGAQMRIRPAVV